MNFAANFKKFANMTEKRLDEVVRRTALDLYAGIIEESPVLTGRFRANNLISIDKEIDSSLVGVEGKSASQLINESQSAIPKKPSGSVIVIQNNLNYAVDLEYGKSKKAPNGVYGINILRFSSILNNNVNEVKKDIR